MFDGQVVRPPEKFRQAAEDYVCVRVVNINELDLNLFAFDYDLTMAILLAHPDGTVFHRYGGRTHRSPMNMDTLVDLMKQGLASYRSYLANPAPPPAKPPVRVRELILDRMKGRMKPMFGCLHCHYVREARQNLSLEAGTWAPNQFWIWPLPSRIGLKMNQQRQYEVEQVAVGSAADVAGIEPGDVLQRLAGRRILTKQDIQWVLNECEDEAISLPFELSREGQKITGELRLAPAWKTGDPEDYKWRVRNIFTRHMLKFLPAPGVIEERLSAQEIHELGLKDRTFGLRIERLNYSSYLAGLRADDVVLGADGRTDFATATDFYRHCELLRRAGRDIRMELVRQGSVMNVMVSLNSLNSSRIETAPRVVLGFIAQELAGGRGLRVGNVTDGSAADKAGVRLGDRVVTVGGKQPRTFAALQSLLNNKSPGDLLTLKVTREGELLQFGYILQDEQARQSELAHLSGKVTERGQILECEVTLKLPPDKHVYSMHRKGFGVPTQLEFRGSGFRVIGATTEPTPQKIETPGLEPQFVLHGTVKLQQTIKVTDPERFLLLIHAYAQVCDDKACHEFRAVIGNDGSDKTFNEFRGNFEKQPTVRDDIR